MSETFPPLTDFNDLAEAEGLEAVQVQLAAAIEHGQQDAPVVEWPSPILPGTRAVPDEPSVAGEPVVLGLSDAAREAWLDFSQAIEDEQGEGGQYEAISDWTSKLPGAVARVAALLELAATGLNAREVGHPCMDDAITLGWLLVPHAQAAFALLGSDQVDVDADAVLRWARGRGEAVFLRSECHQAMSGRFRDVERLKKALDRLEVNHVLQGFVVREKGKKPSQRYRINPACLLSS